MSIPKHIIEHEEIGLDDDYLKLDQTTPQTITGGIPLLTNLTPTTDYQIATKKYIDDQIIASGGYNDEAAQDAVGGILTDTATIDFTYDDDTPEITADVKDNSVTYAKMQNISATSRILGRITAGAGSTEELTAANVRTIINVEDGADVTDTANVEAAGAAMAGGAFHDGFSDFVANEHIDWTNTSEDFSTTGNVECDGITATGNGSFQTINANLIGFLDYTMFDNFNKNELHNAYYRGTVTYTLTGAGIVPSESNAMFDGVEGNRLIISGAADNTTELTVDIELDEALDTYTSAIWQPFVKFRSFTSYSYFRGIEIFVSADGISYVNPPGDAWKTTDSSVDSVYSGLWFGSDGIPTGGYPIKYIRFVFTDHYNTYSGSSSQQVYISEIGLRHKSAPFSRDFVQAVNGKHWGEHNFYPAGSTTSPSISLDSETGDITAGDISGDGYNITGVEIGQTDGLVAFWSFDEANESIIYDRSNSGNDATPQGFSWDSTSGYVDGHLNKSLKFDGTDNWVQAPLMSEISATKDYTISVWIKPKQSPSPSQYMIYQNTHGGTDRNGMNIEEDNVIKFGYYNGSYESVSSDTITALGGYDKWYHIVGINDGGVASLYVNGVKQTGTSTFYAYTASDYMYIGKTSSDNNYYKGEMDEFAVYNRALSEEEALDLYYGQKNKHQLIGGNWLDREKGGRVDGDIRASNVDSVTGYKDNGTAGIDTTFLDADGNTITVSGGIIVSKVAP